MLLYTFNVQAVPIYETNGSIVSQPISYIDESEKEFVITSINDTLTVDLSNDFGFKYWEPNEEMYSAGTVFTDKSYFDVTIFKNENSIDDWLKSKISQTQTEMFTKNKIFKSDKTYPVKKSKLGKYDAFYIIHDGIDSPIIRLVIPLDGSVLSISTKSSISNYKKVMDNFSNIIEHLHINSTKILNNDWSKKDFNQEFANLKTYHQIKEKESSEKFKRSAVNYGDGFKLPWKQGEQYSVTQGWNGATSHTGSDSYAYDFGLSEGKEIRASRGGIVSTIISNKNVCGGSDHAGNANFIVINHDDGTNTGYWHLQSTTVAFGQEVNQGDLIGYSGKTGYTFCNAHLHFRRGNNTSNYYSQTTSIYFQEYPNVQLIVGNWYTSQNSGGSACGGSNVTFQNINLSGPVLCSASNSITFLPESNILPGNSEVIFKIQ